MKTKNAVQLILDNITKQYQIDNSDLFYIFSLEEYCKESEINKTEAFDLWGNFDIVLMFRDHPDYAFITTPTSPEIITRTIFSWLKEINLIKE